MGWKNIILILLFDTYSPLHLFISGPLSSLKHHKDDVSTVKRGTECGVRFEEQLDYQQGDTIVCYQIEKVPQADRMGAGLLKILKKIFEVVLPINPTIPKLIVCYIRNSSKILTHWLLGLRCLSILCWTLWRMAHIISNNMKPSVNGAQIVCQRKKAAFCAIFTLLFLGRKVVTLFLYLKSIQRKEKCEFCHRMIFICIPEQSETKSSYWHLNSKNLFF